MKVIGREEYPLFFMFGDFGLSAQILFENRAVELLNWSVKGNELHADVF
jgi:hypothetical protein